MNPPESKEGSTQSLSKLIETGTSDPKTEGLIRLVNKTKPQKSQTTKPDEPELKQSVQQKEKSEEKKEPVSKDRPGEEYEKEEE